MTPPACAVRQQGFAVLIWFISALLQITMPALICAYHPSNASSGTDLQVHAAALLTIKRMRWAGQSEGGCVIIESWIYPG